jgi:hypothetical protein
MTNIEAIAMAKANKARILRILNEIDRPRKANIEAAVNEARQALAAFSQN